MDVDSFYASAEVQRNPTLAGKPVIIGADPMGGKGRGVVVTCSYQARSYGVRSGMPISQAWTLCPAGVYLKPDFEYYVLLSERVMRVVRGYSDKFEQVSIDEAFMDISTRVETVEDAGLLVERLRRGVKEKTGLTCSVGVAENKSAAKIATDLNKPDRVTMVPRGGTREFLAPLPIGRIPGVGRKTEVTLKELAVTTIGDLQKVDAVQLRRKLGMMAYWLLRVANGLEQEEVREQPAKSLSTERTFEEDTSDWDEIARMVEVMSTELAERARGAGMSFRSVGIKIRFRGFETHTREAKLPASTQEEEVIRREALDLLSQFKSYNKRVRLVGVRVSGLRMASSRQASITGWLEQSKRRGEGDRDPQDLPISSRLS